MWYSMGKRLWKNGRYSVHEFCNWATECSLNMRTWVFNCNLHELSISTYKQLRTVKPYLCMYLIVFTWFFFYIYLYIGSSVPFYDYIFIHCIVTRTYSICILHSIVRINHWIELNRSIQGRLGTVRVTHSRGLHYHGIDHIYIYIYCVVGVTLLRLGY